MRTILHRNKFVNFRNRANNEIHTMRLHACRYKDISSAQPHSMHDNVDLSNQLALMCRRFGMTRQKESIHNCGLLERFRPLMQLQGRRASSSHQIIAIADVKVVQYELLARRTSLRITFSCEEKTVKELGKSWRSGIQEAV